MKTEQKESLVEGLQKFVQMIKSGEISEQEAVKMVIRAMQKTIDDGTTSWEELGTSAQEMHDFWQKARNQKPTEV